MKMHSAYSPLNLGTGHVRFLHMAMELAEFSDCRKRHGCVVVRQGVVIGRGWNKHRNDPNILSPEHVKTGSSVHAEIAALTDAGKVDHANLYVARISLSGDPLLSRPCERCYTESINAGISAIYHT